MLQDLRRISRFYLPGKGEDVEFFGQKEQQAPSVVFLGFVW